MFCINGPCELGTVLAEVCGGDCRCWLSPWAHTEPRGFRGPAPRPMRRGAMAPETLKVDTTALAQAGENFLSASQAIPEAPSGYTPSGSDPLSTAVAAVAPQFLAPIVTGLPLLKAETNQFAQNIKTVAERYAATDALSHAKLAAQVGGSGAAGAGASGAGAATDASSGVTSGVGGSSASAASQSAGQLGQMMQIPMQVASQAAQIPQQVMGMAGSLPQTVMQGVQQVAEQVSQVAGKVGGSEKPDMPADDAQENQEDKDREGKHRREEPQDEAAQPAGAAPAEPHSERAPETGPRDNHRHASPRQSPESVL